MRYRLLAFVSLVVACGGSGEGTTSTTSSSSTSASSSTGAGGAGGDTYADPTAVGKRLSATLQDLANLGVKRAGTMPGLAAGDYVKQRLTSAGISDVTVEPFDFLGFNLVSSSLAV